MASEDRLAAMKAAFPWFFAPPPRCTFTYPDGHVCDGVQTEHRWRPPKAPKNQPIEPTIFDHSFAPKEPRDDA